MLLTGRVELDTVESLVDTFQSSIDRVEAQLEDVEALADVALELVEAAGDHHRELVDRFLRFPFGHID